MDFCVIDGCLRDKLIHKIDRREKKTHHRLEVSRNNYLVFLQ